MIKGCPLAINFPAIFLSSKSRKGNVLRLQMVDWSLLDCDILARAGHSTLRKSSMNSQSRRMMNLVYHFTSIMQELHWQTTMKSVLSIVMSPLATFLWMRGRLTAVLDWERAGWYPEHWDQNSMLSETPGVANYLPYLGYIIPLKYIMRWWHQGTCRGLLMMGILAVLCSSSMEDGRHSFHVQYPSIIFSLRRCRILDHKRKC